MATQRSQEPIDPMIVNAVQRIADAVTRAFEGQQGGAVAAFEKMLLEYGVRVNAASPSPEEIWAALVNNPVAPVEATYRLLRSRLGREGAPSIELQVEPQKGKPGVFTVTAPAGSAMALAFRKDGKLTAVPWPQGETSAQISCDAEPVTIFAFDAHRITGIGFGPGTPDQVLA